MREALKASARGMATLAVIPWLLSFHVRALILGRNRALEGSTQALALLPGILGQYLRRAFLCRTLAACSPTATIEFGTIFSKAGTRIGDRAYIGPRCHLGLVDVAEDVLIAAGVHVTSGAHIHGSADVSRPIRDQPGTLSLVHIGTGVWIGSAAVVMADVGRDSIIGAGAVVTAPIPERVVAAGVPARVIRSRHSGNGTSPEEH